MTCEQVERHDVGQTWFQQVGREPAGAPLTRESLVNIAFAGEELSASGQVPRAVVD